MAVYTEISDEELARFIGAYELGELLSYKGIAEGVENTNYLVHTTKGTFILTIYEKRVDPDDLPFFLGLMEHLSARGVTCPYRRATTRETFSTCLPAGTPRSSPSSKACGQNGRRSSIALNSEKRWRACTLPGKTFRFDASTRSG